MSSAWKYDDYEEQQNFKANVKRIVKYELCMTMQEFANKIKFNTAFMRQKMSKDGRFNLREVIYISKQLAESVEDLCNG